MKTRSQIEAKIKEIESDYSLSEPKATIEVNAPLALMQLQAETQLKTLRWVLKEG